MVFHIFSKNPRDTTRHKKYIYTRRSKKIKKFLLSCTDTLIFPQGGEKTIDANFNCATNQFSRFSILRNKGSGWRGGNNSFLYDRCTKNCICNYLSNKFEILFTGKSFSQVDTPDYFLTNARSQTIVFTP